MWEKKRREGCNMRKGDEEERTWEGGSDLKKKGLPGLLPVVQKFPVNHFYNTQDIPMEEKAIWLRPTFHLCLTFTSSAQFYHSECKVYLSADAMLPCYNSSRAGLIIISPRANMLPMNMETCSTAQTAQIFSFTGARTPPRTCVLYWKWFHFLHQP